MTATTVVYTVLDLDEDGRCCYDGRDKWHLAHGGKPGRWMPRITGELIPCERGYYVLREDQLVLWLGPAIHRVEAEEPILWDDEKGVTARARDLGRILNWNPRTQWLFYADCAEHLLPIYERYALDDRILRASIAASRDYANGRITADQLRAAWAKGAVAWAARRT